MKPLKEELIVKQIFQIVRQVTDLDIPPPESVNFYNSGRTWGRAAVIYGIDLNLDLFDDITLNNQQLVETIIHELVHYNGVKNHGQKFQKKLQECLMAVQNKIKKEENDENQRENTV